MKSITLALLLLFSGAIAAQSPPASSAREIGQLFATLEKSGCQFYRNGSWYNAEQAASHLRGKYDYLLKKGLVKTSESFIDLAATKSSVSGKPYMVKCAGAAAIESKLWFTRNLIGIRNIHAGANNSLKPAPLRGARLNSGVMLDAEPSDPLAFPTRRAASRCCILCIPKQRYYTGGR